MVRRLLLVIRLQRYEEKTKYQLTEDFFSSRREIPYSISVAAMPCAHSH